MNRDVERLRQESFDVLVVGGGIYGAWVAYDATLRGLSVALVERNDWAAGTSSASTKLIHGGLRYLEYGRLGLVRKGLAERALLRRIGPHRALPLRFAIPFYPGARSGRRRVGLGLWLYDRIAGSSRGVSRHEKFSAPELRHRYEFLREEGLAGGFTYGDCRTDDARLTLEIVDGALQAGAVAVNRVGATELLNEGNHIVGARLRDLESGDSFDARAELTVNCCGPWASKLQVATAGQARPHRHTRGVHLVMPGLQTRDAILLLAPERGRVVFLIPWYGRTLLGTTDTDYRGDPDSVAAEPADIAYLLQQANRALEPPGWTEEDVVASFAGLRTLAGSGSPASLDRELVLDEPAPGLITPIGGKLTSSRVDAAKIVDLVLSRLGRGRCPTSTGDRPLPWTPPDRWSRWTAETVRQGLALGLDEEVIEALQQRHGVRLERIYEMIAKVPPLAARIVPDAPFCLAEIAHAARDEMARSLEDVLRRRIPLLLVAQPPVQRIELAAKMLGKALDWSEERVAQEAAKMLDGRSAQRAS